MKRYVTAGAMLVCCFFVCRIHPRAAPGQATRPKGAPAPAPALAHKTPAALRKATEALSKKILAARSTYGPSEDPNALLFLLPYLDSSSDALRDEAAKLIVELPLAMRASAFTKYLSEKYPVNVRMAALYRSLLCRLSRAELVQEKPFLPGFEKRMGPVWSKLINELAGGDITPPYFTEVMVALACTGTIRTELIQAEKQGIIARRILRVLPDAKDKQDYHLWRVLISLEAAPRELVAWYQVESDPKTRRVLLSKMRKFDWSRRNTRIRFQPVLDVAKKDWDPQNAKLAKLLQAESDRWSK